MNVSDFLVERLLHWGVKRIYGYPGDGINPFLGAVQRKSDDISFIQVRHEEMASFMACAHAKFTGELGVCCATSGPGAIQLLNGLYDAKLDNQPVLAIVGHVYRGAQGGSYIQDVNLPALFQDVASPYVNVAMVPSQVRHLIDRSIRIALAERTVTCIILPHDVQRLAAVEEPDPQDDKGASVSGIGYSPPRVVPNEVDLHRAADILNQGQRVAILAGAGALSASEPLIQVADVLAAGVAKALLGKAVLPDELPYVTGSIGFLGTEATAKMMQECDTLLVVGSNFPYGEYLPKPGTAKGVQIDIAGRNLSVHYPMDVTIQADSSEALIALLPLLEPKTDRSWRDKIEKYTQEWWQTAEARARDQADPLNPQLVVWELSNLLPEGSIISADSGTSTVWFARDLKIRSGMMASASGALASMGNAVPYAVAAKFAFPERPAFALVGDGAMQMGGNAELLTVAKYWKEWSDPRLIVIVFNNKELSFVTWEMRVMEGDPKFKASQDIPDFSYANYAESLGLRGIVIQSVDDIGPALNAAIVANRPCIIDVHCDPNVPPLPPNISFEQAKAMASSMLKEGGATAQKTFAGSISQIIKGIFASHQHHGPK